jgi:ABC-type multidrug transport system ATPase subunit
MQLKIERLSKTYPNGVHALRDVSLSIPPGMFGLLGPNGAGKSTLMRILATLQEADAGSVSFGEIDVLRDKHELRRTLGYLPQEFGLYPKVPAQELLDHFALLKGIASRRERRGVVEGLLRQTNLWDARDKKLGGFSGGMRQRFGIAVALLGNPRLIIVDEPTAGLDPAERVRFLNLLSELGENAVVLLSTHIVEDVSELCSRMAIIDRGRILLEAEPLAAIERLRGRVWRRVVARESLAAFEAAHPVISTKLLSGRTVIHVVDDHRPDETFEAVEPDLEDVYFSAMRGISLDRAPAPIGVTLALEPASAGAPALGDPAGDPISTDPIDAPADVVAPGEDSAAPDPAPASQETVDASGWAVVSGDAVDGDAQPIPSEMPPVHPSPEVAEDGDAVTVVPRDVPASEHEQRDAVDDDAQAPAAVVFDSVTLPLFPDVRPGEIPEPIGMTGDAPSADEAQAEAVEEAPDQLALFDLPAAEQGGGAA